MIDKLVKHCNETEYCVLDCVMRLNWSHARSSDCANTTALPTHALGIGITGLEISWKYKDYERAAQVMHCHTCLKASRCKRRYIKVQTVNRKSGKK